MNRIDRAHRMVAASAPGVHAALMDPDALAEWLAPAGMSGRIEHADMRPGGGFGMALTYTDPAGAPGKSTADTDVMEVRITASEPGVRVVWAVDFTADDPAFAGTMTMTWHLTPVGGRTRVEIRAEDVPHGIDPDDHAAGLASTLDNLAAHLRGDGPPGARP